MCQLGGRYAVPGAYEFGVATPPRIAMCVFARKMLTRALRRSGAHNCARRVRARECRSPTFLAYLGAQLSPQSSDVSPLALHPWRRADMPHQCQKLPVAVLHASLKV